MPEQVVLVLQGGGALGAYQVGVYQAMHEAGIEPDWVIGTSIGAINGAIIAGNAPKRRLDRLHEFWEKVQRSEQLSIAQMIPCYNPWANLITLTHGIAGFFTPAIGAWLWPHAPLGTDRAAFYTTAPLRQTLAQLVNFDLLNGPRTRLTLGAVNVGTGEMRYFDSRKEALRLEHVMASGALPPAFPAVRIDGEPYWDGGIYSNSPIEVVFGDEPRRDSLIFTAQLWNPDGPEPQTISQVQCRAKEIQFASRATSHILAHKQLHQLRRYIGELAQYIPETARSSSAVQELLAHGCSTTMHVVYLTAPRLDGEDHTKDIDFSPAGLRARREAGYADTRRAIARAPWEQQADSIEGVVIHDLVPERPGNQAGRIT